MQNESEHSVLGFYLTVPARSADHNFEFCTLNFALSKECHPDHSGDDNQSCDNVSPFYLLSEIKRREKVDQKRAEDQNNRCFNYSEMDKAVKFQNHLDDAKSGGNYCVGETARRHCQKFWPPSDQKKH